MPLDVKTLRLKCTKFDFHWGSAPHSAGGAYNAHQTIRLYLRGLLQGERRRREGEGGRQGGAREKCETYDPQGR